MPLPEPTFDSRTYAELLDESLARVPVHNPEWTNLTSSDPGVTLLQLFAYLSESIIERANLIPERNRQKFLRLLGIPMRAATAAEGLVELSAPKGAPRVFDVPAGATLRAGSAPFATRDSLQVLPLEPLCFTKMEVDPLRQQELDQLYRRLYAGFEEQGSEPAYYETREFAPPAAGISLQSLDLGETLDTSLWIALLVRKEDIRNAGNSVELAKQNIRPLVANTTLTVGVMPALDANGKVLHPLPPSLRGDTNLVFELPDMKSSASDPRYRRVRPVHEVDLLSHPGVIELPLPGPEEIDTWKPADPLQDGFGDLPPRLDDDRLNDRVITWLRVRRLQPDDVPGSIASARLSWIGINAARVVQRAHVPSELLPRGTGEPDQRVTVANTPVVLDTVRLTVNGETWTNIDDLGAAPPEVAPTPRLASAVATGEPTSASRDPDAAKVFYLDPESGEISFGDGAHGMRPPARSFIQISYDYGGGPGGMLAIDTIRRHELDSALRVRNPVPTWGAAAAETVAAAERRIPNELRHHGQLVAADDYRDIVEATPGVELGRVEILPLVHPDHPRQVSPGVVTVVVIPRRDPHHPNAPQPDRLVLETICRHVEPRRVLTTELHIRGPVYVPIWVSIGIEVMPGADLSAVRPAVIAGVKRFLSPLAGGFSGGGWPLGKTVEDREILAAAARIDGIAQINGVELSSSDSITARPEITLQPLELPQLVAIVVQVGDPTPMQQVRGDVPPDPAVIIRRPVPVVPEEC